MSICLEHRNLSGPPYIRLYLERFAGSPLVEELTRGQRAYYLLLIYECARRGGYLPGDDSSLAKLTGLRGKALANVRSTVVEQSFVPEPCGCLTQNLISSEIRRSLGERVAGSKGGKASGVARRKSAPAKAPPPTVVERSFPAPSEPPEPEPERSSSSSVAPLPPPPTRPAQPAVTEPVPEPDYQPPAVEGDQSFMERMTVDARDRIEKVEAADKRRRPTEASGEAAAGRKHWVAEACDDWHSRFGKGSAPGGRIGKGLKPLVREHDWPTVRRAWQRYLAESRHPSPSAQDFRSHYADWLPRKSTLELLQAAP